MAERLTTLDPRIERVKLMATVLGAAGCAASLTYFALAFGWLSLPASMSQWAAPIVMNTMIWGSTLSIVLGAGGGILATRVGQPARYFAVMTATVLVLYAGAMCSLAFVFD